MASKILITDAISSVGQAIHSVFEQSPYALLTPTKSKLNWEDSDAVCAYLKRHHVSIILNTLGWSETPSAQQQQDLVLAAENFAKAAKIVGCDVIHLSSYRVFGGENKTAYDEDDTPLPLGPAGEAFLRAEKAYERELERHVCLRVSWVVDIIGHSLFGRLMQQLVVDGPALEIDHQRRGAPVSTLEVGRMMLAMVNQILCGAENWGVFHLASSDPCSSAEFAETVADILEREGELRRQLIIETLTEEELALQGEPDSAALTVRRCRDNFGYQVLSWRQGLTGLVRAWLERYRQDT